MPNTKMGLRSINSTYKLLGKQITSFGNLMTRQGTGNIAAKANTRTARKSKLTRRGKRTGARGCPAGSVFSAT